MLEQLFNFQIFTCFLSSERNRNSHGNYNIFGDLEKITIIGQIIKHLYGIYLGTIFILAGLLINISLLYFFNNGDVWNIYLLNLFIELSLWVLNLFSPHLQGNVFVHCINFQIKVQKVSRLLLPIQGFINIQRHRLEYVWDYHYRVGVYEFVQLFFCFRIILAP